MPKLTMTIGLPASGKSTWAKAQVAKSRGTIKRVNKDDLRDMIDDGKWSKSNEKQILAVRDNLIEHYLNHGLSVVVDDTNLAPKHEETLRKLAKAHNAEFKIKSFLDVSVKTCIERDLKRPKSVGSRVIKSMFDQWLKGDVTTTVQAPEWDSSLPTAIICDIDGTLAHMNGRGPYDWDRVGEDDLDRTIASLVAIMNHHSHVIFLSGRDSVCRSDTQAWLKSNGLSSEPLFMRPKGDMRKDSIVKRELYEKHIKGKFNVLFVLDDRNQVVDMWRNELGLKVFQVAEGNF